MKKLTLLVLLLLAGLVIYVRCREQPWFSEKLGFLFRAENPAQQQQRQRIAQLENQLAQVTAMENNLFGDVATLRKSIDASNPADVARFNSKITAYQTVSERAKDLSRRLKAEKQKFDNPSAGQTANISLSTAPLPANTPLSAAPLPAKPAPKRAAPKRVIVYSTSTCPVCVKAKNYLVKKGIFYSEVDVDSSRAAQDEFKKLGGTGVPLILVGDTRIHGFDAQEIDKALQ